MACPRLRPPRRITGIPACGRFAPQREPERIYTSPNRPVAARGRTAAHVVVDIPMQGPHRGPHCST
jgi:hypothetical protein